MAINYIFLICSVTYLCLYHAKLKETNGETVYIVRQRMKNLTKALKHITTKRTSTASETRV